MLVVIYILISIFHEDMNPTLPKNMQRHPAIRYKAPPRLQAAYSYGVAERPLVVGLKSLAGPWAELKEERCES